jgi:hypothetical protein
LPLRQGSGGRIFGPWPVLKLGLSTAMNGIIVAESDVIAGFTVERTPPPPNPTLPDKAGPNRCPIAPSPRSQARPPRPGEQRSTQEHCQNLARPLLARCPAEAGIALRTNPPGTPLVYTRYISVGTPPLHTRYIRFAALVPTRVRAECSTGHLSCGLVGAGELSGLTSGILPP